MSILQKVLKAGTRSSNLAILQAKEAINELKRWLPELQIEIVPFSSPGDRDKFIDLRESPADFFTKDLDEAILNKKIDFAIHSAKDMPDSVAEWLDWFWLPSNNEQRDCIVLREGEKISDLPKNPVIGVSSNRRAEYCTKKFPGAIQKTIRGTIEERLEQLDNGLFDVVIMAGIALVRLGLTQRITEWIPLEELATPTGQGSLAITFKKGDAFFEKLRLLFIKPVIFAGAGAGEKRLCTLSTMHYLHNCDVCVYDALLDPALLEELPKTAIRIDAGKRSSNHKLQQSEISNLIARFAREGKRVLRLKGGDPGIFSRIAEEIEILNAAHLPYFVVPGISALQSATTATGFLLTRRNISRGFTVITPRTAEGEDKIGSVARNARENLPLVLFMATQIFHQIAEELISDGMLEDTPAVAVFNAGFPDQHIIEGTLRTLPEAIQKVTKDEPAIIMIGEIFAKKLYKNSGILGGKKILLTSSQKIADKAIDMIRDFGGIPIEMPFIKLEFDENVLKHISSCDKYDLIVMSSPSAVDFFMYALKQMNFDIRRLPKLAVSGRETATALKKFGIYPDYEPYKDFGADGLKDVLAGVLKIGIKVLRLKSDITDSSLAEYCIKKGAIVDEVILYKNIPITYSKLPKFDAIIFASSSGVNAFLSQFPETILQDKDVIAIGKPTAATLRTKGIEPDVIPEESTITACIKQYVLKILKDELEKVL